MAKAKRVGVREFRRKAKELVDGPEVTEEAFLDFLKLVRCATVDEVAEALRVSPRKVLKWIAAGELEAYKARYRAYGTATRWQIPLGSVVQFQKQRCRLAWEGVLAGRAAKGGKDGGGKVKG